jgi:HTH-type transcriptional regulator / antitoxin HigA
MTQDATEAAYGARIDEYLSLVAAFPLAHIRDDAHLDLAMAVIDRLLDKGSLAGAEQMYLDALTDLVETYEDAHVPMPARTGLDALRFLMASNDLEQVDLAPVLGRKSLVSEVLGGKRELELIHIKKLAEYFKVSPGVFID